MERRAYLASLVLALAGCGEDSDGGGAGDVGTWFWLQMESVTAADVARRIYPEANRQSVRRAVSEGKATDTTTESPLVEPGSTIRVRHDGTVYAVSSQVVEDRGVSEYVYTVELDPVEGGESDAVQYGNLPAADRDVLAANGFGSVSAGSDLGYGVQLAYSPANRNRSALVPTPRNEVIEWESGVRGRVSVVDSRERRATTYRYAAEAVGSVAEVGDALRAERVFALNGLSEEERAIVDRAVENSDGYRVEREGDETEYTPSQAVRGIYDRFDSHADRRLDPDSEFRGYGEFLVEYRSEVYWAALRSVQEKFRPRREDE